MIMNLLHKALSYVIESICGGANRIGWTRKKEMGGNDATQAG